MRRAIVTKTGSGGAAMSSVSAPNVAAAGYHDVRVLRAGGEAGAPAHAPFDRMVPSWPDGECARVGG